MENWTTKRFTEIFFPFILLYEFVHKKNQGQIILRILIDLSHRLAINIASNIIPHAETTVCILFKKKLNKYMTERTK